MSKKIWIIIAIVAVIIIGVVIAAVCINVNNANNANNANNESEENINEEIPSVENPDAEYNPQEGVGDEEKDEEGQEDMYSSGTHHATIVVKDYGTIKLELYADTAPITVANFAKLVNEGFYDGLTFHRIMEGFMIQGGDPLGNGTGGSDETIKGEFSLNGVENDISHVRGVISMARSSSYDSASSQFFIVHKDSTFLDGQYAAFGKVTEGMAVVDKICEDSNPVDDNGTILSSEQPVIEKITMED